MVPHGGRIFRLAQALGVAPDAILDFSASINPYGPPQSVKDAIIRHVDHIRWYPDADASSLRNTIATRHGIPLESLLLTNGASEAIDLAIGAREWRHVWVLDPAFSEYRAAAQRHRLSVSPLSLTEAFDIPWDTLKSQVEAGDLVIINNPHNPSGRAYQAIDLHAPIQALIKKDAAVLIDEAFVDFLPDPGAASLVGDRSSAHLLVIRSLTKFYAIPGLRLGYVAGDPHWIAAMREHQDGWSVNQLALEAGEASLADGAFDEMTRQWLGFAQQQVKALWPGELPVIPTFTDVNFFLLRWGSVARAQQLAQSLRQQGILVREANGFRGLHPATWRVAMLRPEDNQALYHAVSALLHRPSEPQ